VAVPALRVERGEEIIVRKRAVFSLVGALVAAIALVSASGAATTKAQKVTRIDVSTRAAVIHYLHSIHVKAKGAVIQRGFRNYAGVRCPGKHWACASTKHTVVQITGHGGQNRFACTRSHCAVVQISGVSHGVYFSGRQLAGKGGGGSSTASCVKNGAGTLTSAQDCTITQSGSGPNKASVYENSKKSSGQTVSSVSQTATFTATIKQTATDGVHGNTACVTQNINFDASTSVTKGNVSVIVDGHQSVIVKQDAAGSGPNTAVNGAVPIPGTTTADCDPNSMLGQDQTLTSAVKGPAQITQRTDNAQTLCGDGVTGPVGTGDYRNLCLDIEQNQTAGFNGSSSVSGLNTAKFIQTDLLGEIANTNGSVTQTEGNPSDGVGGIVGTINQWSNGTLSTAETHQHEVECERASKSGPTPLVPGSEPVTPPNTNWCNITGGSGTPSSLTQNAYGPAGVGNLVPRSNGRIHFQKVTKGLGQATQLGFGDDFFSIDQISTQTTDDGSNVTNNVQGDCTTAGNCQAGQTTTINGTPTSDGYTSGSISNLVINCTTSSTCSATPPPAPEISTGPDAQTTSTSATFTWAEAATAGVTLKCSIDGGATFTTCDSPTSTSYTGLPHGPHTFEVKAVDNTSTHNESAVDSFSWEVIPYLTFEATTDGASAGWNGVPGSSSIHLTTGSVGATTFAQFTIHDRSNLKVSDLALLEPSFNTDTYMGAPRYEIDLDNGDYLFGYPPQAGFGSNSWDINCGGTNLSCVPMSFVSWAQVQTAEGGATITDALIEADFPTNHTYTIADFTYDGYVPSNFVP
jgi:hypothetical protein